MVHRISSAELIYQRLYHAFTGAGMQQPYAIRRATVLTQNTFTAHVGEALQAFIEASGLKDDTGAPIGYKLESSLVYKRGTYMFSVTVLGTFTSGLREIAQRKLDSYSIRIPYAHRFAARIEQECARLMDLVS